MTEKLKHTKTFDKGSKSKSTQELREKLHNLLTNKDETRYNHN